MSYTEIHFAKFKVLASSMKESEKYIKENKLDNLFDIKYKDGELEYIDQNKYGMDSKYYSVSGGKYLIEYIAHEEFDDNDSFNMFSKNENGTYDLGACFYNGGTCLDEILEEKLDEEYEED
jgi:hypothetical protein